MQSFLCPELLSTRKPSLQFFHTLSAHVIEMKVISFYTIIAACLRTLLDFSTPVAAYGGWNINSDTCSEDDTNVLNKYFGRAAFAHENLAEAFGRLRGSMTEEIQQLVLYVLGGPNPNDATAAIAAAEIMFAGGIDPTRAGSPYIRGLASLNRPISQATAYNYPNGVVAWPCLSYTFYLRH